jgi:hypothetical protein
VTIEPRAPTGPTDTGDDVADAIVVVPGAVRQLFFVLVSLTFAGRLAHSCSR